MLEILDIFEEPVHERSHERMGSNPDGCRDAQSRSPLSGIDLWPTAGPGTTSHHFLALVAFFVDAASGQETLKKKTWSLSSVASPLLAWG